MSLWIQGYWPHRPELRAPEPAAERFATYLLELRGLDASFADFAVGRARLDDDPDGFRAALAARLVRDQYVTSLTNRPPDRPADRVVMFAAGVPGGPGSVELSASPDFMARSDVLRRVLAHLVGFWKAEEAGICEGAFEFWLRWMRDPRARMLENVPLAPGAAGREPWLGGTLWTRPEREPARLIAAEETRRARGA